MSKFQFQATENRVIVLPAFIDGSTGLYVETGVDVVTVKLKSPGGTVYTYASSDVTPKVVWDSDIKAWVVTVAPGDTVAYGAVTGKRTWCLRATSNASGTMLPQWRDFNWGDYVDDITAANTKLGTPAVSIAADITAANTKLGTPAVSIAADIVANTAALAEIVAGVGDKVDAVDALIGTPAVSIAADIVANTAVLAEIVAGVGDKVDAVDALIGIPDVSISAMLSTVGRAVDILFQVGVGRWRVTAGNQFIIYGIDGEVLLRFDLKDVAGLPTSNNIYERVPVRTPPT